ncbi:MAG: hypothetical protein GF364_05825 [Candidatus Lokiarchaeota archaeon]|nr:hypothetical protein [Candidatus Lokiarchaeota archaeon]
MASFPALVERTSPENVKIMQEKAQYFVKEAEKIEGIRLLGARPKKHHLIQLETTAFEKIAEDHPRRGFFLRDEFKEKGIIGMAPGISKKLEISIYGLTWDQVYYLTDALFEIARKYGIKIKT